MGGRHTAGCGGERSQRARYERATRYHAPGEGPIRFRLSARLAVTVMVIVVLLAVFGLWRASGVGAAAQSGEADPIDTRVGVRAADDESQSRGDPGSTSRTVGYGLADSDRVQDSSVVIVHVVGAVNRPGIVELPAGSRVVDAIDAAGGAREQAELASLNLAAFLTDGTQVYVPVAGEAEAGALGPYPSDPAGAPSVAGGAGAGGCVDLNTASEAELQELDGVGPKLAARIVEWRAGAGPVSSATDLVAVPGIGSVLAGRIATGSCQ